MPGFLVSNEKIDCKLHNAYDENCKSESIENAKFTIKRNTLNKFIDDKCFIENSDFIIVLDGVILNKDIFFAEFDSHSMEAIIIKMYKKFGESWFSKLRGTFSGVLYDKKKDTWFIFTNHIGERAIFYYANSGFFVAGSQVNYVLDALKYKHVSLSLNEQSAYKLLTFAFMDNGDTLANEVKRLDPGHYLRFKNGAISDIEYFKFKKNTDLYKNLSENELIEILDHKFRKAVKAEYNKDEEYGYKSLADISGGLDSRMSLWVAHSLNLNRHVLLKTYGAANSLDEIIAKIVAEKLNDEILIRPLNDMTFLRDVDIMTFMTNGLVIYSGSTGMHRLLRHINTSLFGLNHMGQLGDVIVGSYIKKLTKMNINTGRYSEFLSDRLTKSTLNTYEDNELYLLYTRGFRGILGTQSLVGNFLEPISAFLDVDFFQLCLDIPLKYRVGHKLYKQWVISKYPGASEIMWEATRSRITESTIKYIVKHLYRIADSKIHSILRIPKKDGMNPLDFWYQTKSDIRTFCNKYFNDHINYIHDLGTKQLLQDTRNLFDHGSVIEKTMVMTLESALKLYFS